MDKKFIVIRQMDGETYKHTNLSIEEVSQAIEDIDGIEDEDLLDLIEFYKDYEENDELKIIEMSSGEFCKVSEVVPYSIYLAKTK